MLLAAGERLYSVAVDGRVAEIGFLDHRSKGLAFVDLPGDASASP